MLAEAVSHRNRTAKSERQKQIAPSKFFKRSSNTSCSMASRSLSISTEVAALICTTPSLTSDSLISTDFSARCRLDLIIRTLMIRSAARSSAAAKVKIANSDVYSEGYAEFVETFERVVGLRPLKHYLFIEGGALAVENCLKAAMDWKVRKNMAAGRGERGTQILHFRHAFHGRSGYTMSLTNTDPRKTDLFANSIGLAFRVRTSILPFRNRNAKRT